MVACYQDDGRNKHVDRTFADEQKYRGLCSCTVGLTFLHAVVTLRAPWFTHEAANGGLLLSL